MFVNWDAVLVLLCLQHAAAHCVCGTEMLNATDSVPLVPVVSHHWSLFLSNAVADSEGVHLAPPPPFSQSQPLYCLKVRNYITVFHIHYLAIVLVSCFYFGPDQGLF